MAIKGFGGFTKSKVATHKVISDSTSGIGLGKFGNNSHKPNVSFKSGTKGVKMNGK